MKVFIFFFFLNPKISLCLFYISFFTFSFNHMNHFFVTVGTGHGYETGDVRTAAENYEAIIQFLERFPERSQNPFYITSESYGGHYMPTLTQRIITEQSKGSPVNFRGVMVGNPFTELDTNSYGQFGTYWGHQVRFVGVFALEILALYYSYLSLI